MPESVQLKKPYLIVSFSGGETSAYMLYWLLKNKANEYNEIYIIFANTGQENEETLIFVDRVSKWLKKDIVWLEAVINPEKRKGTTHKVVSFETACRDESLFEDMVKKYGIPNMSYPHCNRELKLNAIKSYVRTDLGLSPKDYDMAIGIRSDEIDRIAQDAKAKGLIYPLIQWHPTFKNEINKFWTDMPFRLNLKGYQGNCKWCWKKSNRKLYTIYSENPEFFDVPMRLEKEYGWCGSMAKDQTDPRVFFRQNRSTEDVIHEAKTKQWEPADDDAVYERDLFLDAAGGCEESCEIDF